MTIENAYTPIRDMIFFNFFKIIFLLIMAKKKTSLLNATESIHFVSYSSCKP